MVKGMGYRDRVRAGARERNKLTFFFFFLKSVVNISLVPRPRIRREKWPGIHCLRMRERFRKFSANKSEYDKLHLVVMRRNNQTRYTAYSVAAVFTRRSVVSILLILTSYPGHVSCQILLGSQQLLVSYSAAVTDYSSG